MITGVASGALNAYIASLYEMDTEESVEAVTSELESFWLELSEINSLTLWKGGFVYGFFFEKGLYNPA